MWAPFRNQRERQAIQYIELNRIDSVQAGGNIENDTNTNSQTELNQESKWNGQQKGQEKAKRITERCSKEEQHGKQKYSKEWSHLVNENAPPTDSFSANQEISVLLFLLLIFLFLSQCRDWSAKNRSKNIILFVTEPLSTKV